MKTIMTLLGVAAGGSLLYVGARPNVRRALVGRAGSAAGRLSALGAVGVDTMKGRLTSSAETLRDWGKQSFKAWRSVPRLRIQVK